jgi:hypothetical protein
VVTLIKPPGARFCFPALTVPNDCFPMHAPHAQVKPTTLLKVVIRGGSTALEGVKSYEIHVGRKREKDKPEPALITWSEVEQHSKDCRSQACVRRWRSLMCPQPMVRRSPSPCVEGDSASPRAGLNTSRSIARYGYAH